MAKTRSMRNLDGESVEKKSESKKVTKTKENISLKEKGVRSRRSKVKERTTGAENGCKQMVNETTGISEFSEKQQGEGAADISEDTVTNNEGCQGNNEGCQGNNLKRNDQKKKVKRLSLQKDSLAGRKNVKNSVKAVVSEYFSDCTSSDMDTKDLCASPVTLDKQSETGTTVSSKLKNLTKKMELKNKSPSIINSSPIKYEDEETSDFEEKKLNIASAVLKKQTRKRKTNSCKADASKAKKAKQTMKKTLKKEAMANDTFAKELSCKKTSLKSRGQKVTSKSSSRPKANKLGDKVELDAEQVQTGTSAIKSSAATAVLPIKLDQSDVTAVLLHMEGLLGNPSSSSHVSMETGDHDNMCSDEEMMEDSDESDEEDWEVVKDHHGHSPEKSQLPDQPIEITLDAPNLLRKRKKREFDWKAYVRRRMNRYQKEVTVGMHKVHLLCLISRGLYLNNICQDETLQAQAVSITMAAGELTLPTVKSCNVDKMAILMKWFVERFPIKRDEVFGNIRKQLGEAFALGTASSSLEKTLLFVVLLRSLGYMTRVVMSLQPVALKDVTSQGSGKKKQPQKAKGKTKAKTKDSKDVVKPETQSATNSSRKVNDVKKKVTKPTRSNKKNSKSLTDTKNISNEETSKTNLSNKLKTKNTRLRKSASKVKPGTYRDLNEEEEDPVDSSSEEFVPVEEDICKDSGEDEESSSKGKKQKHTVISETRKKEGKQDEVVSSASEFEEETVKFRSPKLIRRTSGIKNRKVVSSDSECLSNQEGTDEWTEVYLEKEQRWICFDSVSGRLNKPYDIERQASQPVQYVLAFSPDGTIKDVTARYASEWLTETRKLRTDADWWEDTLSGYLATDQPMNEQEDREIQSHLMQRPMPTSVSAFKNHPLYALKRHLLKFEAIYPDTAVPLGYIKGEPIYARECVHILHSRENWLKEGRAVRLGEEPYKFVKSRPKWNKPKADPDALDLEVFGVWQTELYIPPPAVDGKVPRNAHGNVELFLPTMLPGGTVHLQIPALNRVARKLDIDCAPAMVGWDNHCGFSHPLMDGWIVCEEFKDVLLAAWDEDQEIQREKELQKREKRVYGNWKLLTKGLLIKERLKKRFDLEVHDAGEEIRPVTDSSGDKSKIRPEENASDYKMAWPQNRLKDKKSKNMHFEVEKLEDA